VNPGFDAQVERHHAAEPEAAVDVARHNVAGPVRAQVDARGADEQNQRGADGDQGVAQAARAPVGGQEVAQQAEPVHVVHDVAAGEAWLIDDAHDGREFLCWAWPLDKPFDQPVQQIRGTATE